MGRPAKPSDQEQHTTNATITVRMARDALKQLGVDADEDVDGWELRSTIKGRSVSEDEGAWELAPTRRNLNAARVAAEFEDLPTRKRPAGFAVPDHTEPNLSAPLVTPVQTPAAEPRETAPTRSLMHMRVQGRAEDQGGKPAVALPSAPVALPAPQPGAVQLPGLVKSSTRAPLLSSSPAPGPAVPLPPAAVALPPAEVPRTDPPKVDTHAATALKLSPVDLQAEPVAQKRAEEDVREDSAEQWASRRVEQVAPSREVLEAVDAGPPIPRPRPALHQVERTRVASLSAEFARLFFLRFRNLTFSGPVPRVVRLEIPAVESTDGGRLARQSLVLFSDSGNPKDSVVAGFVDIGKRVAQVRTLPLLHRIYKERLGQDLELPTTEYETFLTDLREYIPRVGMTLEEIHLAGAAGEPSGPTRSAGSPPSWTSPWVSLSVTVVGVLAMALWWWFKPRGGP